MTTKATTPVEYNTIKKDYFLHPLDVHPIEEYERHWSSIYNLAIAKNTKQSDHEYKCHEAMSV